MFTAIRRAPRQLCHLNIAAAAPYDHPGFVERCVGIEIVRAHGRANITGSQSRCDAIGRRTDVQ